MANSRTDTDDGRSDEPGSEQPGSEQLGPGRLVLQLGGGSPSEIALEAAMRVASAFGRAVDSLLVQDSQLRDLALLPFAREISPLGLSRREMSLPALERDLELQSASVRRRIEALARAAQVPVNFRIVTEAADQLVDIITANLDAEGLIALGEPLRAAQSGLLHRLMSGPGTARGVLFVGPEARRIGAPVVMVIDALSDPRSLIEAAHRMLPAENGSLIVLMLDGEGDESALQDAVARRFEAGTQLTFLRERGNRDEPASLAEVVRRLRGGFVVAHYGGRLVPSEGPLGPLVHAIECPLLLLR